MCRDTTCKNGMPFSGIFFSPFYTITCNNKKSVFSFDTVQNLFTKKLSLRNINITKIHVKYYSIKRKFVVRSSCSWTAGSLVVSRHDSLYVRTRTHSNGAWGSGKMPGISLIRSCILEGLWHGLNTSKFVKNTPAANTSPDPIRRYCLYLQT